MKRKRKKIGNLYTIFSNRWASLGRFGFDLIQIRLNPAHRLPVVFPTLIKVLARLVFALPSNVVGFTRHFYNRVRQCV